jgi:hypothetical protein
MMIGRLRLAVNTKVGKLGKMNSKMGDKLLWIPYNYVVRYIFLIPSYPPYFNVNQGVSGQSSGPMS